MKRKDIDALRLSVRCAAVLEQDGWAMDLRESTRRAVKYRRGDAIVIVTHEGKGWFDPLSDAKGDVYSLVGHLENFGFADALKRVQRLIGFVPAAPVWTRPSRPRDLDASVADRWRCRAAPWQGSPTWRYLTEFRAIPGAILSEAMRLDLLREGPRGSMWAKHVDNAGGVIGWEERGLEWRGFATGGAKRVRDAIDRNDRALLGLDAQKIDGPAYQALSANMPTAQKMKLAEAWPTLRAAQQLAAHERTVKAMKQSETAKPVQRPILKPGL